MIVRLTRGGQTFPNLVGNRWLYCWARIPLRFSSDYWASQWDFCFRSSPKSQRHVDYWFSMPASETTRSKFIDPVVRSNAVGRNALLPIRSFIHYHLNHPSRVRKHSIKSGTPKFFSLWQKLAIQFFQLFWGLRWAVELVLPTCSIKDVFTF